MNEVLLFFAIKYNGNWNEIYNALDRKEKISIEELENVKSKIKCKYITIIDDQYPESLKAIYKPPFVLFYYGDVSLLNHSNKISVIGSRDNSEFGAEVTIKLVKDLVQNDFLIVSGMAKGIDSISHRTALENGGKTIAVLGSGIDYCYPEENLELYELIKINGLLVSEMPNNVEPNIFSFKIRNRIVSGLSKGILVTESKERSGTMNTVTYGLNQGKEIYCVPSNNSKYNGTNSLIKEGAKIVNNINDITSIN